MSEKQILVVDDEISLLEILHDVLKSWGYNVVTAESAEAARENIDLSTPDLVISDLRMPGESGLQLLEWIKSRNQQIPVIIATAYPSIQSVKEAMKNGAVEYLTKPFQMSELKTLIAKTIG